MYLHEISFNNADKQIKISQDEYQKNKKRLLASPLPFKLDVVKADGSKEELTVAVSREDYSISVHLLNDHAIVGRLYLARPDIFPGAYYVDSIGILPEYQGRGLGPALYDALLKHIGISLVGIDQSLGARKMWVRTSRLPGNILYAVMPSRQQGNMFFPCMAVGDSDYVYINYQGIKKPVTDGSSLYVILTTTNSAMAKYIKQHMRLHQMRYKLARTREVADPFAAYTNQ